MCGRRKDTLTTTHHTHTHTRTLTLVPSSATVSQSLCAAEVALELPHLPFNTIVGQGALPRGEQEVMQQPFKHEQHPHSHIAPHSKAYCFFQFQLCSSGQAFAHTVQDSPRHSATPPDKLLVLASKTRPRATEFTSFPTRMHMSWSTLHRETYFFLSSSSRKPTLQNKQRGRTQEKPPWNTYLEPSQSVH